LIQAELIPMAQPVGSGGGKPDKGGGGIAFVIFGLNDASDSGNSNSGGLTNLSTGFTLTGTIGPSVGSFSLPRPRSSKANFVADPILD
jgi:hypothetical protein